MPLLGFFITYSSINIKARHSATHADYVVLFIPKCAAHGVREIHTLILAVMISVHLAEAHEYSTAITLEVKHIVFFGRIFVFLANIYTRISLVFVLPQCRAETNNLYSYIFSINLLVSKMSLSQSPM